MSPTVAVRTEHSRTLRNWSWRVWAN